MVELICYIELALNLPETNITNMWRKIFYDDDVSTGIAVSSTDQLFQISEHVWDGFSLNFTDIIMTLVMI